MLGLNLGYTHFKYDKNTVFSGFVNTHGVPGFQEYARPRWVNNLFVQYNGPRILAGGYFSARADGQFISKQLINSDTTPGETVNSLEDPLMRAGQIVGDQWLANARLALSDIPIGNLRMEVSLWGKNLFDNRNAIQTTPLVVNTTAIYQPARTYGLDLSFDF